MICALHPLHTLSPYRYVVVVSFYEGKLLLSRHRDRVTWETQGGHIEQGETPLMAARRELWEESGATDFALTPLCDYQCTSDSSGVWGKGQVFRADIRSLGPLPASEMVQVQAFSALPAALTYPAITPQVVARAMEEK